MISSPASSLIQLSDSNTRRNAGFFENFNDANGGRGRESRGFENDRVTGNQCGAIFQTGIATGKFQGVTQATTPNGCLIVYAKFSGSSEVSFRH